jgi:hypothetical protein
MAAEEDVVPAGDKDSADGTGNVTIQATTAAEDFVLLMMAVPTIQATQAISFDLRKYAVPAKLKEMLISFEEANCQTSLLQDHDYQLQFAYTRN